MLLDSCLQFLQATLPIPLRGTDLLMPGKDLYHPQILILLQQVREHALADRAGIKHTVRERRAERFHKLYACAKHTHSQAKLKDGLLGRIPIRKNPALWPGFNIALHIRTVASLFLKLQALD